jgi:hypothetical protein
MGSPVGEEGYRRSVRLLIETSYEFYLSTYFPIFYLLFLCSHIACFGSNFSPFGIKSPKSVKLKGAPKEN